MKKLYRFLVMLSIAGSGLFFSLAIAADASQGDSAKTSAIVTVEIYAPATTPADAKLALGGSFNNWDPSQGIYNLARDAQGVWRGQLPAFAPGKIISFKVTRGDWNSVEVSAAGQDIADREYQVKAGSQTLRIQVVGWKDQLAKTPVKSTATGNVLTEQMELPSFGGKRAIYIYLPPDYYTSHKHYPVIYMTDGRNLFDVSRGAPVEWGMDELMEEFAKQDSPLTSIVVGIDHAGPNRTSEYSPWDYQLSQTNQGPGKGQVFADWLVKTLKPHIDKTFRTLPDRQHTSMMGSSMGGLISCYTALRYQEVISKAACFSPAFLKQLVGEHLLEFIHSTGKLAPMRIYMDMGDAEGDLFGPNFLNEMQQVRDALLSAGFNSNEIRYSIIPNAIHNEAAWKLRTKDVLLWLNQPNP